MRRVILTVLVVAGLLWLLWPDADPAPARPGGAAARGPGAGASAGALPPSAADEASGPARHMDVGRQLREEMRGGGALSRYNPFDY